MAVVNPTNTFRWALPIPGASIGVWGTVLNLVFGEADAPISSPTPPTLGIDGVIDALDKKIQKVVDDLTALTLRVETLEQTAAPAFFARAFLSGTQSIPHNSPTTVNWALQDFDEGGVYAPGDPEMKPPLLSEGLWQIRASITGPAFGGATDDVRSWKVEILQGASTGTAIRIAEGRSIYMNDGGDSSETGNITVVATGLALLTAVEVGTALAEFTVKVTQFSPKNTVAASITFAVDETFFEAARIAPLSA